MSIVRLLKSRHSIPLLAAAGLLVIVLEISVSTMINARRATDDVTHTFQVMAKVSGVVAAVKNAEAEQRGYIITGDGGYLQTFESDLGQVRSDLDNLEQLLAENPSQRARLQRLRGLIERRIADLRKTAEARQQDSFAGILELVAAEAATRTVLEIRSVTQEMQAEEEALLDQRRRRLAEEMRFAVVAIIASGVLALAMAGHTFRVMRRAIHALNREASLLRQKERAERSDREKSEFLANMSHEIRTPMNAVLGFSELLRGTAATPRQKQYIEAINTSGRALLALINDILDLSKIEAGRLEVVRRPTSVRAVFQSIQTVFAEQAIERGLRLDFVVADSVPAAVLFDPTRLRQILFNCVGNALKFTVEGSVTVEAAAELTPDDETTVTLQFRVSDTGMGIAPENQQMIFEPFRQVRDTLDRNPGGTGLGLSITRRLTRMLDGEIQLTSEAGRGSTFRFTFPRVPLSAELPDDEARLAPEEDFNRLRPSVLLAADDVALNRELFTGYFENTHHRLILAAGGREVVELARQQQPDLILMDVRMPVLDGCRARELIREVPELANIPMIAVTASSMKADEQRLRTLFEGFIRKPFTRSSLFRELERLLPPVEEAVTRAPERVPPAAAPDDPRRWRELLEWMQRVEHEAWPHLLRSMGFREMEQFARDLAGRAAQAQCDPARTYAERLLAQVQGFEITAQENSLREFPDVVGRLARAVGEVRS